MMKNSSIIVYVTAVHAVVGGLLVLYAEAVKVTAYSRLILILADSTFAAGAVLVLSSILAVGGLRHSVDRPVLSTVLFFPQFTIVVLATFAAVSAIATGQLSAAPGFGSLPIPLMIVVQVPTVAAGVTYGVVMFDHYLGIILRPALRRIGSGVKEGAKAVIVGIVAALVSSRL